MRFSVSKFAASRWMSTTFNRRLSSLLVPIRLHSDHFICWSLESLSIFCPCCKLQVKDDLTSSSRWPSEEVLRSSTIVLIISRHGLVRYYVMMLMIMVNQVSAILLTLSKSLTLRPFDYRVWFDGCKFAYLDHFTVFLYCRIASHSFHGSWNIPWIYCQFRPDSRNHHAKIENFSSCVMIALPPAAFCQLHVHDDDRKSFWTLTGTFRLSFGCLNMVHLQLNT